MRDKVRKRLRSQGGETIAEVLIALLIAAVALMMLAQMISSSSDMIIRSEKNMEDYYQAANPLAKRTEAAKTGTVSFSCENGSMKPFESLNVHYCVGDEKLGDVELISFYYEQGGGMP